MKSCSIEISKRVTAVTSTFYSRMDNGRILQPYNLSKNFCIQESFGDILFIHMTRHAT